MKHILEVDSVMLNFGLNRILQNVYLKSETGAVTGILGRNGTGKSCLLRIIFGELIPDSNSVRINGQALMKAQRSSRDIKYLPQHHFIPSSLRIGRVFVDFELDWNRFVEYFPNFKSSKDKKLRDLSGGERRIIEIYSILASNTKFCLLDEPFSQVMPIHVETLKKIILQEKANKGIILTDHLYGHILEISDELYVINHGTTYLTDGPEDLVRLGYLRSL